MTRTQGWGGSTSHFGNLQYAVDWDNGTGNWLVRAANGGGVRCVLDGTVANGFGNYVGIFNSIANKSSVYAHLVNCGFFLPGTTYEGTQNQGLVPAGDTGHVTGLHLHFHVLNGSNITGTHVTVPFEMSDQSSFSGTGTNGPAEPPVAYDVSDTLDAGLRSAYLAVGGASGSWWNVGSAYRSTNESNEEFGGVCRNTTTAFSHLCASNFGVGLQAAQNYIDYKGVRHSVYRTNVSGHVKGQIQGTLSNFYAGQPLSRYMGAPLAPEANNIQNFQGGYLHRRHDVSGSAVRVEVYFCDSSGCTLAAIGRWGAHGDFCSSLNGDKAVTSADQSYLAQRFGTSDITADLNMDGTVTSADQTLLATRFGYTCVVLDP